MNDISIFKKSNRITVNLLNEPEKILLWSIREWVLNIKIAKDPRPKLINGFSKILIQEAVMPLDKMMRLISYHYNSPIDIRCHCSNLLGRTEIDILCLISIIQNKSKYNSNVIAQKINKEYSTEFLRLSTKLANSFQRASLLLIVRDIFVKKYFVKNENNTQVIYFNFKKKEIKNIIDIDNNYHY